MLEVTRFQSRDLKEFKTKEECKLHEICLTKRKSERAEFTALIESKVGPFDKRELRLGGPTGEAILDSLPFKAPWMSPFGACFITVSDLRRNESGAIEFQLADENSHPYEDGTVWRESSAFYAEWPD